MKNQNIEDHFEALMMELHNSIGYELRQKALKFNFTFSQMEVVRYVKKEKNPTMKDIANYLHITPPSVTAIIEGLIKKGLIKKEIDKNDHIVTRIIVTSKVSKMFNALRNKKVEAFKNILSRLNSKDKSEFVRILKILNKELNISYEK